MPLANFSAGLCVGARPFRMGEDIFTPVRDLANARQVCALGVLHRSRQGCGVGEGLNLAWFGAGGTLWLHGIWLGGLGYGIRDFVRGWLGRVSDGWSRGSCGSWLLLSGYGAGG